VNGAEKPGQAAAHLLVIIKVEVLTQHWEAATRPTCCQRIPENVYIAAQSLKRSGRGVVDLLVEQRVVAARVPGAGHGGMVGQAVRGRRLVALVVSLRDESGPEVDEAVV